MDSILSFLGFFSVVGIILGLFLCADHRKVDRRFKTGYKNNEPKDEVSPILGRKVLMICFPTLIVSFCLSSNFKDNKTNHQTMSEKTWSYRRISSKNTMAEIENESDRLIVECLNRKKLILKLETKQSFAKNKIEHEILIGTHRSLASVDSVKEANDKFVYSLEKGQIIKLLMKEKDVTIRMFDSLKNANYSFSLKNSKKTIQLVLNDCNIKN